MPLSTGMTCLITGASMGIGQAIAYALAKEGVHLALLSRSKDKLDDIAKDIEKKFPAVKVVVCAVDIRNHQDVDRVVEQVLSEFGKIDILINNAGLALGAPNRFWELPMDQIDQMTGTNINGVMYITHSVLRRCMWPRKEGTILNISSVTGLEVPPFPGETIYHASKAYLEAFSNALRIETVGSNIRVLVLRPGVVRTHFHLQRVQHDQEAMDDFMEGYDPLVPEDLAENVVYMLSRPLNSSIKALDCVPTAQRALIKFDREWKERNGTEKKN